MQAPVLSDGVYSINNDKKGTDMKLNISDGRIQLSKKLFIPLMSDDRYIVAPAEKMIYIVRNGANGENSTEEDTIVIGYNMKGVTTGTYVYRHKKVTRLFQRGGYANIVYCDTEPDGKRCYYQARLLPVGFCTEIYALHYTDANGKIIYFDEAIKRKQDEDASDEAYSVLPEAMEGNA